VTEPARTRQGFRVYNPDYSAPEVREKKPPLPAADLYSIGRCLLFLLGGDLTSGEMPTLVDDRLQRFVRYLTRPSPLQRAQDAWDMFVELERVRAGIYGPHRFQEFVV
jgi:serine/threonine protein kinase